VVRLYRLLPGVATAVFLLTLASTAAIFIGIMHGHDARALLNAFAKLARIASKYMPKRDDKIAEAHKTLRKWLPVWRRSMRALAPLF